MDLPLEGRRSPPFFLLVALLPVASAAAELSPFFRASSETYSEPVSIKGALNDWEGSYRGGERQWTSDWAEAGVQSGPVGISAFVRYDADFRFSRSSADLYHSLARKLPLDVGRTYDIDVGATVFSASGIRLSWRSVSAEQKVKLTAGVSLMYASNLQDGHLAGQATPFSEKDFDFGLEADYHYEEDQLFDRPDVAEPTGHGVSFDLRGQIALAPRWHFDFEARDLLGRIWWPDAPYTRATAADAEKTYDGDGYVESISPILSGVEGYEDYTQRLTPAISTELHGPLSSGFNGIALYRRQFDMDMWGLGVSTSGNHVNWGVRYWPGISSVGVEMQWRRLIASVTVDSPSINEIRAAWLNIEYR